jgi:hypothetical protein
MNHVARRAIEDSTESLFLAACTSTPVTDDSLFTVRHIATLLEDAIVSNDARDLRAALERCDSRQTRSADLFACAVQTLADTLPPGVSNLRTFVHGAARLERMIFDDLPMVSAASGAFPAVYVS